MSDSKVLADVIGKSDDTKLMSIADIYAWMNSEWHDVAGSRSLGVANTYTNTHNYPMTVYVLVKSGAAAAGSRIYINGEMFQGTNQPTAGLGSELTIDVPPLSTYYASTSIGTGEIVYWKEKY
jgi:hypothetical protein